MRLGFFKNVLLEANTIFLIFSQEHSGKGYFPIGLCLGKKFLLRTKNVLSSVMLGFQFGFINIVVHKGFKIGSPRSTSFSCILNRVHL